MTAERYSAILSAVLRAEHEQHIAEIEAHAATAGESGDEPARRRLGRVERLRALPLPWTEGRGQRPQTPVKRPRCARYDGSTCANSLVQAPRRGSE
ncbi:MAG: hypothetical protein QOC94_2906 [Actinoplanes sp.]|jgi:hypothetical protein|nr:hypothetical protein [Actinoplanes sp.]MDT5032735.1 hypothetical protein [Actinoplanes sp.]